MTCHLINKAVMKKNCVEALNQHAQPLEKRFTWNLSGPIIISYTKPEKSTEQKKSTLMLLNKADNEKFAYL